MRKYLPLNCLLAALLMLALAACVKNDAVVPEKTTVSVNVINATDEVFNFYLKGTRQSSVTGIYPLAANGYIQVPYGQQLFTFKKLFNNQTFENADTLFTLPVQLDSVGSNYRYSIFAAGLTRNHAFYLADTLAADSKSARLRFVVASPGQPALRVYLNDTLRFATTTFKSASGFNAVGNGQKVLKIFSATGTGVLYTTTLGLSAGRSYTLFSQGSGANFKAGLMINQ